MTKRPDLGDLVSVAIGLLAAALTDALLVAAGGGRYGGVPLGVLAAPLLVLLASPAVRRTLLNDTRRSLLVVGVAWTLAPFVDEHLTGAVVLDGFPPDLVHHVSGWVPLFAGTRQARAPEPIPDA